MTQAKDQICLDTLQIKVSVTIFPGKVDLIHAGIDPK
jgi:hypothetical protein